MYKVKVIKNFSSAHYLRGYQGNCENIHGHNWKVELTLGSSSLNSQGMVIDFRETKSLLEKILSELDHKNINELEFFKSHNPTSENIAYYIYISLNKILKEKGYNNVSIVSVGVWETDTSCAIYEP